MTLDEYEQYFLTEREKKKRRDRMLEFIAGLMIGYVIGVMALAIVSINRGDDES